MKKLRQIIAIVKLELELQKLPIEIGIVKIRNGYLVHDVYAQNKEELKEALNKFVDEKIQ